MKPTLPQGTRDFGPDVVRKRQYILDTIKTIFNLYGFQPLETPAMENLETLMGKYGEEGDKLIFKILNNGLNDPKNTDKARAAFENALSGKNDKNLTERALKYDLTIPFARYVAMNHAQLTLPFKRYQVQPVWRADRPQRGRYREFYQCDADVVGSKSFLNEIELINIYEEAFKKLGIEVSIKINNRKVLQGIAEYCGCTDKLTDITTAIDKLDKIGREKVTEELILKGIPQDRINNIFDCIFISDDELVFDTRLELEESGWTEDEIQRHLKAQESPYRKDIGTLNCLRDRFYDDFGESAYPVAPTGLQGVDELTDIFEFFVETDQLVSLDLDTTLARGLNYYTGSIFEVKAKGIQMGSIGGGGRYDDLTGLFGVPGIPGVGISFGVDRIYDVMEELSLFPSNVEESTAVLFFNLGETESKAAYRLVQQLRKKGIACEIYHESAKMDKQFKYAEKKKIPFAVIIGSRELEQGTAVVRSLVARQEETMPQDAILDFFSRDAS